MPIQFLMPIQPVLSLECSRLGKDAKPAALCGQWGVRPRSGERFEAGEALGVYEGAVYPKGRSAPPHLPTFSDMLLNLNIPGRKEVINHTPHL